MGIFIMCLRFLKQSFKWLQYILELPLLDWYNVYNSKIISEKLLKPFNALFSRYILGGQLPFCQFQ